MINRFLKYFLSGRFTLILAALISGIYLYLSFGNQSAFVSLICLIKYNLIMKIIMLLLIFNFSGKALHRIFRFKFSRAGSALIFLSLSVIMTGTFLSLLVRQKEIHRYNITDRFIKDMPVKHVSLDMPASITVVGEDFDFFITDALVIVEDAGRTKEITSFPFTRTSYGYAYVNDAGISPIIRIESNDKILSLSHLDLLPPGKKYSLIPVSDYKLKLFMVPEADNNDRSLSGQTYNITKPSFRLILKKSDELLFDNLFPNNDNIELDHIRLKRYPAEKWYEIVFVSDPAIPAIYAGLLLLPLGIIFIPFEIFNRLSL